MNTKIKSLLKKIEGCNKQLKLLQSECKHENVHVKYESNTGNFDPMEDCWWIVVNCKDCDKYMSFDSVNDRENYRKFSKFAKDS
jgi:hypothetical protein